MGDHMTHATHGRPGLVLVADSPQLYDQQTPASPGRFAVDLVLVAGSIVAAYGLSFATLFSRRR
jgi:hypothetical protein